MTDRRLLDAHMRRMFALREQTAAAVRQVARVHGFDSDEFVEGAVEVVLAGQTEEALATWGHLSTAVALGDPNDGGEIEVDAPVDALVGAATHAGTPLETVYHRPGIKAVELAANGLDAAEIFSALSPDLDLTVGSDVAMAGRNAEQAYGSVDRRVVGWRRVPNVGACVWCRYIATQRYKRQQLAPAHRNCKCGTEPIIGRVDPGQIIDPEGLARLKRDGLVPGRSGIRTRTPRAASLDVVEEVVEEVDVAPIAQRIEADRARAREILDNHNAAAVAADPGPRPRLTGDIDPRNPDQMAAFRRDVDEWERRSLAAHTARRQSTLRTADRGLSSEGEELLERLEAVGAEVVTEARGRIVDLDGMREAALRAEQVKERAKIESSAFAVGARETAQAVRERIARERFGVGERDLRIHQRAEVRDLANLDPELIEARRLADDASARALAATGEWERAAGGAYFAERDAILEVLEEIRPTGKASDLSFVKTARSGESKAVQDAIKDSARYYPEDWTKNLGETRQIIHKKVERGFQRDNRDGTIDIALSKGRSKLGLNPYEGVATHELAHAMESTNSRITAAEWAFFKKRTDGLKAEPCWAGAGAKDSGIRDGFPDTYFGKSYGGELDSHKELLSMSMEWVFSGSPIDKGKPPLDDSHLAWLLGVWVSA